MAAHPPVANWSAPYRPAQLCETGGAAGTYLENQCKIADWLV
jgi:hypothetical protein